MSHNVIYRQMFKVSCPLAFYIELKFAMSLKQKILCLLFELYAVLQTLVLPGGLFSGFLPTQWFRCGYVYTPHTC